MNKAANKHKLAITGRKRLPNELRIDAAGMEKVKRNGEGAAASVLVELSRIWKKKPGGTVKKSQKETSDLTVSQKHIDRHEKAGKV
ncbi:MAG: hypothetical protein FJ031_08235, partial [Chloroflexi bacterium]|nr:hypothetical protein [Chloroflexota bacterium]